MHLIFCNCPDKLYFLKWKQPNYINIVNGPEYNGSYFYVCVVGVGGGLLCHWGQKHIKRLRR